jgi:hypothetical protein
MNCAVRNVSSNDTQIAGRIKETAVFSFMSRFSSSPPNNWNKREGYDISSSVDQFYARDTVSEFCGI